MSLKFFLYSRNKKYNVSYWTAYILQRAKISKSILNMSTLGKKSIISKILCPLIWNTINRSCYFRMAFSIVCKFLHATLGCQINESTRLAKFSSYLLIYQALYSGIPPIVYSLKIFSFFTPPYSFIRAYLFKKFT